MPTRRKGSRSSSSRPRPGSATSAGRAPPSRGPPRARRPRGRGTGPHPAPHRRRCAAEIGPALVEAALAGNDLASADAARAVSLEAAYRLNLPIAIATMRLAGGRLLLARRDAAGAAADLAAALETFERL